MKKIVFVFIAVLLLSVSAQGLAQTALQKITVALNTINLEVNGQKVNGENILYNGTTYVPLRKAAEILGKEVSYNSSTKTANISDTGLPSTKDSPLSITKEGITVNINKVTQDSDSLKVYVTYVNNTNDEISTAESLAKIVANGKQYEYDSDFNFERWYKKDVPHAASDLEPGVKEESVIFFKAVPSASTINIALGTNYEDFKFNNVKIQ